MYNVDPDYASNFVAGVDLARTADAQALHMHFAPVGDPTRHATDGEHHGEHVGGNADGAQNNSAIKVDIGIKVVVDKVAVGQSLFFQFLGQIQKGVFDLHFGQHLVAHFLHDFEVSFIRFERGLTLILIQLPNLLSMKPIMQSKGLRIGCNPEGLGLP